MCFPSLPELFREIDNHHPAIGDVAQQCLNGETIPKFCRIVEEPSLHDPYAIRISCCNGFVHSFAILSELAVPPVLSNRNFHLVKAVGKIKMELSVLFPVLLNELFPDFRIQR